jgi:hypothetical protein
VRLHKNEVKNFKEQLKCIFYSLSSASQLSRYVPADIGFLRETIKGIHCNIMGTIWYPHPIQKEVSMKQ